MDTKSISSTTKLIQLSGVTLLMVLSSILILVSLFFDFISRTWQTPQQSLTLPLLLSGIISSILGYGVIPILRKIKAGQVIQEDGPQTHLKKAGTPTMGGIFFIPVVIAVTLLCSQFSPDAIAVCLVTFGYAFIGWVDDWQILRQQSNKGISPKMKLTLQVAIAVGFCLWILWQKPFDITTVALPGGINLALGWLFFPLAGFVFAAESNATNLTDGVDGLAAGTSAIAFWGLGAIIATTNPDLTVFCMAMSGGCLGFLLHNRNPAKVFMGDTGSLALGGALAAIGLVSSHLWTLFVVSGIFFLESLSVIAQVSYYKATKDENGKGKRLFKMAPLHHHLELSGWRETQVVGMFYLVNMVLVVVAFFI
ncbi:MAG: phospho-N-acetylmuramoyl-pentapeptide-transferase [Xenococcaceae cyanobacterium MO_207.B15]|nr:phospho-N-acetylmuramoyl-pentapeptide-transferase [Xenococcaceae cyanobacterium MO_207.B15]